MGRWEGGRGRSEEMNAGCQTRKFSLRKQFIKVHDIREMSSFIVNCANDFISHTDVLAH